MMALRRQGHDDVALAKPATEVSQVMTGARAIVPSQRTAAVTMSAGEKNLEEFRERENGRWCAWDKTRVFDSAALLSTIWRNASFRSRCLCSTTQCRVEKPSWLVPPFGGWQLCARAASYYCTNVIVLTDPSHDSMSGKGGC